METSKIPSTVTPKVTPAPTYSAEDLLGTQKAVYIQLKDQLYTLRITRAGKLILTK